jgi:hypothetical protein
MEIDNVKINWKPLLEVQKKLFQDLYPDMDIENTFSALERQLSSNLIPSRIIINRNRVKGFAYLTGTDASSGRAHGLVCFPEPDLFKVRMPFRNFCSGSSSYLQEIPEKLCWETLPVLRYQIQ